MAVPPDDKLVGSTEGYFGSDEAAREEDVEMERIGKVYGYD